MTDPDDAAEWTELLPPAQQPSDGVNRRYIAVVLALLALNNAVYGVDRHLWAGVPTVARVSWLTVLCLGGAGVLCYCSWRS